MVFWDRATLLGWWTNAYSFPEKVEWVFSFNYREWASRYIEPLFSFFFPERVIYPFDLDVKPSRETRFTNAAAVLTG